MGMGLGLFASSAKGWLPLLLPHMLEARTTSSANKCCQEVSSLPSPPVVVSALVKLLQFDSLDVQD